MGKKRVEKLRKNEASNIKHIDAEETQGEDAIPRNNSDTDKDVESTNSLKRTAPEPTESNEEAANEGDGKRKRVRKRKAAAPDSTTDAKVEEISNQPTNSSGDRCVNLVRGYSLY
jgi:hypothetical protein